jgi:hypothetical protein
VGVRPKPACDSKPGDGRNAERSRARFWVSLKRRNAAQNKIDERAKTVQWGISEVSLGSDLGGEWGRGEAEGKRQYVLDEAYCCRHFIGLEVVIVAKKARTVLYLASGGLQLVGGMLM